MAQRVSLLLGTAHGMAALHAQRPHAIVHRDLKSLNILVFVGADDGRLVAKIADFGLAYTLATSTAATAKTAGGQGSAPWMAPEVYDAVYDQSTDVWAFGMVVYECLTRKQPYEGLNAQQIMKQVCVSNKLPDMALVERGCPDALTAMMRECCAFAPNDRPSFAALVTRLEALAPDAPKGGVCGGVGGGTVDERMMGMLQQMMGKLDAIDSKLERVMERVQATLATSLAIARDEVSAIIR
jgi:serine/threonine protein kinase